MEGRCTIFLKVTTQIVQIKIVAVLKKKKKKKAENPFAFAQLQSMMPPES